MAVFRDPFKGLGPITADNALQIQLENLRDLKDVSTDFTAAVEKIILCRNVFLVAKESGFLEQIPYWPHFITILQWLNREADLGPYQAAPRFNEFNEIDATQSSTFLVNANNLEINSMSQPDYKMASTVLGAIAAQKRINTEPKLNNLIKNEESRLAVQRTEFEEAMGAKLTDSTTLLGKTTTDSVTSIQTVSEEKLSAIQQADALKEWQGYYDDLIGRKPTRQNSKVWLKRKASDKWLKVSLKFLTRPFLNGASSINSSLEYYTQRLVPKSEGYALMADQYKLWKNIWLITLVASEAILTYLFTSVWKWSYKTRLTEILAYKLIPALLFGAFYVTANKNYRIYSNLTDQVKHRSVVAKTIRGIVLDQNIGAGEDQKDYKAELVTAGAKAMFELKTTGHLTKKESSGALLDIFRDASGR